VIQKESIGLDTSYITQESYTSFRNCALRRNFIFF